MIVISIRIHCGKSLSKGARSEVSHESESRFALRGGLPLRRVSGWVDVGCLEGKTEGWKVVDLTDVIVEVALTGRPGPRFDGFWTDGFSGFWPEGEGGCGGGDFKGDGDCERMGGEGS